MKTLATLIFLSLICFLRHSSAAPVGPGMLQDTVCCPKCHQVAVPKGRVKHVAVTAENCKVKAIVVTTVCNETRCIDGDWTWAKKLLTEFQEVAVNTTSPPAPFNLLKCSKQ